MSRCPEAGNPINAGRCRVQCSVRRVRGSGGRQCSAVQNRHARARAMRAIRACAPPPRCARATPTRETDARAARAPRRGTARMRTPPPSRHTPRAHSIRMRAHARIRMAYARYQPRTHVHSTHGSASNKESSIHAMFSCSSTECLMGSDDREDGACMAQASDLTEVRHGRSAQGSSQQASRAMRAAARA